MLAQVEGQKQPLLNVLKDNKHQELDKRAMKPLSQVVRKDMLDCGVAQRFML